jgi:hypothetical protein
MTIKKKIGDRFVFLNTIPPTGCNKLTMLNVRVLEGDKIIYEDKHWVGCEFVVLKDGSKLIIK